MMLGNHWAYSHQQNVTDVEAAVSFIAQFIGENGDNHVPFHSCSLSEAIAEACFAPLQRRKIIALYLHNAIEPFSKMFCPTLISGDIRNILEQTFYFLGWDVSDSLYHDVLKKSLNSNIDSDLAKYMVTGKHSGLFILYPVENCLTVYSVICGSTVKNKELLSTLQDIQKKFKVEIQNEIELEKITKGTHAANDIGSREFQQLMFDRLGDRDYDCFEFDEHQYLEEKIGFALYGPPQSESGYDEKQKKNIKETLEKIREHNNKFAEWRDQITVSFIYNCLEPVPEEKLKRIRTYNDYNPYTDIMPVPVYVLRKCRGSANPCRLFIDNDNRVYNTWSDYIQSNKLHKCTMVLPKDGRYMGDENDQLLLESHLSPACGIGNVVLRTTDVAATGAGLISGGIFIAALIPAIPVAPVALTAAAITGAAVGVYSVIRSATSIYDRYAHSESLSFANSEARGAYINIVAGTLGFVGAGATTAVSRLAAQGVNIGQGAQATINAINIINVGASGIGIANSSYQVYDEWINEQQKPSWLTVLQLTSSILFFGNAVYNFRTAGTIIEESQTQVLKDHHDSLRSGRHRKMFNKMMKESIRQTSGDVQAGRAEVISTIRNMGNKDEVYAVLTRNNKMFNKNGVRFSAEGGEIRLNGISVDLFEFGSMSKVQRSQFLIDLPPTRNPPPAQISLNESVTMNTIKIVFDIDNINITMKYKDMISTGCTFTQLAATLLEDFSVHIQQKILQICRAAIDNLCASMDFLNVSNEYFSHINKEPWTVILKFVIDFLKQRMNDYEEEYNQARQQAAELPDFNEQRFNREWGVHPDTGTRAIYWFEKVVNTFVDGHHVNEVLLNEFIQYVTNLLTQQIMERLNEEERTRRRQQHTTRNVNRISCSVCGGFYFTTD